MPKMPDIRVYAHLSHKITFEHRFPCKVLADGLFTVAIAEDLRQEFAAFYREQKGTVMDSKSELKTKLHADAVALCNRFAEWKISAVESREVIILYEHGSRGRFFVSGNGLVQPQASETGDWVKLGSTSFGRDAASFGLSADIAVRVKITSRTGAVTHKWGRPTDAELGPHGKELRAYELSLRPPFYAEKEPPNIPYTEKAAAFFVKEIQATLQRAHEMHEFLSVDEGQLAGKIEAGIKP